MQQPNVEIYFTLSEAAAYAGISLSGMSQRKMAEHGKTKRRKSPSYQGKLFENDLVRVNVLRTLSFVNDRERLAADIAKHMNAPAIITDRFGHIMGVSSEAECLLWRSAEELISYHIETIGCPLQIQTGEEVSLQRKGQPEEERVVIKIQNPDSREELPRLPSGLTQKLRTRVEEALKAVENRRPHEKWIAISKKAIYPALGGGVVSVKVEKTEIGTESSEFLVYRFSCYDLATQIANDNACVQSLPSDDAREFLHKRLYDYTRQISLEFPSESVTLFLLFPPLSYQAINISRKLINPNEASSGNPAVLVSAASFGLPEILSRNEVFYDGEKGNEGIVMEVIKSGKPRVCDFTKPEEQALVRFPNFFNADLNLRSDHARNSLIVPLLVASQADGLPSNTGCMGALRLFNCFQPGSSSPFTFGDKIEQRVRRLEPIVRELSLMLRGMMRATYAEILDFASKHLSPPWKLEDFVEMVLEKTHSLLDFRSIVVWRLSQDKKKIRQSHMIGVKVTERINALNFDSYPGRAFRHIQTIDIFKDRSGRDSEEEIIKDFGREPRSARSGFEVPILDASTGTVYGTLGLYNSAQAHGGSYSGELKVFCEKIAHLIGLKVALARAMLYKTSQYSGSQE